MINIQYKTTKEFTEKELEQLFLAVNWSSGSYPDKLVVAMRNSSAVFTAWDGDTLVGLINVLDDGIMTAYVHYLLVLPEYQHNGIGKELVDMVKEAYKDYLRILLVAYSHETVFYEHCGFKSSHTQTPMYITSLWT